MSKLSDVLESKSVDPRRILVASKKLESLRPEDKELRLLKRQAKKSSASEAIKEKAAKKGRSGKTVSKPLIKRALAGEKVSAPAKTRITRALNHVLEQKGKDKVALTDLF